MLTIAPSAEDQMQALAGYSQRGVLFR
jgi:hypothetical protein